MNLKIAIIGNKAWTSEVSVLRMNKMDCGRIPWTLIMMIKRIILTMVMMMKRIMMTMMMMIRTRMTMME